MKRPLKSLPVPPRRRFLRALNPVPAKRPHRLRIPKRPQVPPNARRIAARMKLCFLGCCSRTWIGGSHTRTIVVTPDSLRTAAAPVTALETGARGPCVTLRNAREAHYCSVKNMGAKDRAYFLKRALQEQEAARVATCAEARERHEELAVAYRLRCRMDVSSSDPQISIPIEVHYAA